MTEASTPTSGTPFKDASTRLVGFGVLSVIVGGVSVVLGLLHAAVLFIPEQSALALGLPSDSRPYLMGALLYMTLGAVFIGLGLGSVRRRRWAPPLLVIVGRIWILGGFTLLVFLPSMLDGLLADALGRIDGVDDGLIVSVKLAILGGAAILGILVPALFVWAYRGSDVRATCRAHDTVESWTERCSPTVLGLSVGLVACAVLLVPLALQPAVPLFGVLVKGWPGAILIVATAVACLYLARLTFDRRMSAWWLSTGLVVALGVSVLLTLIRVDPSEIYRAVGYSDRELALLEGSAILSRSFNAWATAVFTVACVGYMIAIRKHFLPEDR